MIEWRDGHKPPEQVIATKFDAGAPGSIAMQRPLCAYPRQATYTGRGSTSDPGAFLCRPPAQKR